MTRHLHRPPISVSLKRYPIIFGHNLESAPGSQANAAPRQ
jgi:hypothetical protein